MMIYAILKSVRRTHRSLQHTETRELGRVQDQTEIRSRQDLRGHLGTGDLDPTVRVEELLEQRSRMRIEDPWLGPAEFEGPGQGKLRSDGIAVRIDVRQEDRSASSGNPFNEVW